jgi:hypothetical protein
MKSLIAVVTAEQQAAANAYMESRNHGPLTFSIPMIDGEVATPNDDGTYASPITHYGCHWVDRDDVLETVAALDDTSLDATVMRLSDQIDEAPKRVGETTPVTMIVSHKRFATRPAQWGWDVVIRRKPDSGFRVVGKRLQFATDNKFETILGEIVFTKETARRWTGELNLQLTEKTAVSYRLIRENGKVLARGRLRVNMDKAVELPKFTKLTRDEPEESED